MAVFCNSTTSSSKTSSYQVTACEEFPRGNFITWEADFWFLNSTKVYLARIFTLPIMGIPYFKYIYQTV